MDPGYRIEVALPEHVNALQDLERAAASLFAEVGVTLDPEDVTPLVELRKAQAQGLLWVALDSAGDVAGFALVGRSRAHPRAHLAELDVHPAHGRRGLGAALVEAVCAWASEATLDAVTLTTFRDVPWNAPWYQRLGFAEIPETALDAELRQVLRAEVENGLDRSQRVAMRRTLD
jgi:GNAT superfamily N-acetyltransferase